MGGSSQASQAGGSDLVTDTGGGDPIDEGRPSEEARKPGRLRRLLGGHDDAGPDQAEPSLAEQIAARDAVIDEMRRDIAALWLAFGHHERTLREVAGRLETGLGLLAPPGAKLPNGPSAEESGPEDEAADAPAPGSVPISQQLSDLDDVLAAIERATDVLERTHADELDPADSES